MQVVARTNSAVIARAAVGSVERRGKERLREFRTQIVPAVGTDLPIDAVAFDIGFVAHELLRRPRRVLDFEGDAVAGSFLGDARATEWTRCHTVSLCDTSR